MEARISHAASGEVVEARVVAEVQQARCAASTPVEEARRRAGGGVEEAGRWPQVDDRNADRAGAGAAHDVDHGGAVGLADVEVDRRRGAEVNFDGCVQRGRRVPAMQGDRTDRGQDGATEDAYVDASAGVDSGERNGGDGDIGDVAGDGDVDRDVDIEERGRSLDGDGVVGRQQALPVGAPEQAVVHAAGDERAGAVVSGVCHAGVVATGVVGAGVVVARVGDAGVEGADVEQAGVVVARVGDAGVDQARVEQAGVVVAAVSDAGVAGAGVADADVAGARVADADIAGARVKQADVETARVGAADAHLAVAG
ncbi:predicted protein [Mycobacterium tuberculosis T17]|nr:predicted protein [Mycobacterium tuberculosis T17]